MVAIRDQLNPLYQRFLPELFDSPAIVEQKATCDHCVMVPPPEHGDGAGRDFFHPRVKCCTYHPRLANYLIGGVLADATGELEEGKRRVQKVVAARIGVTPRWVAPSAKYTVLLEATREASFGRTETMRCPYYIPEPGLCGVWRYRQADCMSWFCKYDGSREGQNYWRAFGGFVTTLEFRLSHFAMQKVSGEVTSPPLNTTEISLEELEDRPPRPELYSRWWGPWEGREEAFYIACHAAVRDMTDADVAAIMAYEPEAPKRRLAVLGETYQAATKPVVPERLRLNPNIEIFESPHPDTRLVRSYSKYDPTLLPEVIFGLLPEFTAAHTVAEVQARILAEHDAEFADPLVLQLYQKRILIDATRVPR